MNRIVALVLLLLGVAAALTWIVVALLLDEPSPGPGVSATQPSAPETTIVVPATPAPAPVPERASPAPAPIPETAAPEYRPDPKSASELKPETLWAMDLQSGEEMIFRFAAPSAPGAIVYLSIEKGSREGVQKVADFCSRARGEWGGDVIGTARRFGIGVSDAAAAEGFCRAVTSSVSDPGARPR